MQYIENLKSKVSLIKVIICLALFITALFIINGETIGVAKLVKITGGVSILDFEKGYTVERAYDILNRMGAEGRAYYLKYIIPMDFVFPFTYMLFYASTMIYLLKITPEPNRWLNYVPLVPIMNMLLDYTENALIICMLTSYPQQLPGIVKAASVFTNLKLNFISMNAAIISAMIIFYVAKRFFMVKK
ncbi:MAG: hypothetical protein N2484_04285 [Clostridia bacterium]|nr:hypothetical protein [Clostridia bacterium]